MLITAFILHPVPPVSRAFAFAISAPFFALCLARRSLSTLPLDATAQAFLYACPVVGAHSSSSFISMHLAKLPLGAHVGPPCQWISTYFATTSGIALTKFIDWCWLNIEQSYRLRAPHLDGTYCLTQCKVAKKLPCSQNLPLFTCAPSMATNLATM